MFLSAMTNHVKAAAFGCDSTLRSWNRWNTGFGFNMNQLPICDSDSTSWCELIVLVKVCQGFEGKRRPITWGGSVETPTTWRSHRVHPAYEGGSMTSWSCKEISTVTWALGGMCFLTLRNVGVDHAPSITVGRRTCLHCNLACFNTPKTLHTMHGRTDMDGQKDLVGIQCRSTSSSCSNEQMEVSACSDLGCDVGTWPPRVPWTATWASPAQLLSSRIVVALSMQQTHWAQEQWTNGDMCSCFQQIKCQGVTSYDCVDFVEINKWSGEAGDEFSLLDEFYSATLLERGMCPASLMGKPQKKKEKKK